MIPEERAEYILSAINFSELGDSAKRTAALIIAAQIREAVEEHRCDQVSTCRTVNDNCIYWAKKEAYEDAAKIAFLHNCDVSCDVDAQLGGGGCAANIRDAIRARAKELEQ